MTARTMRWQWNLLLALILLLLLFGATATLTPVRALAQQPTPDLENEMLQIAKGLYCPVCVGVPLDVCETQACEQWRNLIIDKLKAGQTADQIRQYFIDQYGERVLGAPPPQGFNLGAYIFPFLLLIAGAGLLFFPFRGWLRARAVANEPATATPISAEYAERIARELRERE